MKRFLKSFLLLSLFLFLVGNFSCSSDSGEYRPPTKLSLRAFHSNQAPKVDGKIDQVWNQAKELLVPTRNGPNVHLRVLYSGSDIYFLVRWKDKTKDDVDEVWQFDGLKWRKGPINDAIAFFWNIDNSIEGFNKKGCFAICHAEGSTRKRGGMMEVWGEVKNGSFKYRHFKGDVWDLSLGASNIRGHVNDFTFSVEDAFLLYPKSFRRAKVFIHHDAYTGKGFLKTNRIIDKTTGEEKPEFKLKSGLTINDTPYPTLDEVEKITDYSIFKAGDKIPYMLFDQQAKWGGSRDDISGKGVWQKGEWIVEIKRKLNTGHSDDIQFVVSKGKSNYYVFALAIFDRTIIDHKPSPPVTLELRGR